MESQPGYGYILDEVLSGLPLAEITPKVESMPADIKQLLLCTLCCMRTELQANCGERGDSVSELLTAQCHQFVDNRPTCRV